MKIRTALIISAATLALVGAPAVAYASVVPAPAPITCEQAKADLTAKVALVVQFNQNVYPDGKVPAVDAVTPALLRTVLTDPDLGAGARAQVQAALAAFAVKHDACAKPPATTTPAPTTEPTSTVTPTTTTEAPPVTETTAPTSVVILPVPVITGSTSQIGTAPSGSVNTGGE